MAYSASNPPQRIAGSLGSGRSVWMYVSADPIATVDDSGYFANGGQLGMKVGDIVFVVNTTGGLTTIAQVGTVSATPPGAATIIALTAVP
jgi:hypothetical protein